LRDGKRLHLSSLDGSGTYQSFILKLHQELAAAKSKTKFRAGLTWPRFLAWFFFFAFQVPNLPLVGVLMPEERKELQRNRPRRYRPHKVPAVLLPYSG
jgi:hypothetical protein